MISFRHFICERQRWLFVGLLFLVSGINYLDRQTLSVLAPMLRDKLHFSAVDYSYVVTAFLTAYTLGYCFCARVIEIIGVKVSLALAVIVWSGADILHAFATGWVSLALCRSLLGLAESFSSPAGVKAISDWVAPRERGFAMAIFSNGNTLGALLAPPLIAALALALGWQWAFVITGILGLLLAVVWIRNYHAPDAHPCLSEKETKYLTEIKSAEAAGAARMTMLDLFRNPLCLGFFIARFLTDPISYFFSFWLPDYLVHSRGFSLALIGMVGWLPYLAAAIGYLVGGSTSDFLIRRGWQPTRARHALMLVTACLMPLAILAYATSIVWLAIILIAVLLAANSCWMVNQLSLISESVSSRNVTALLAFSALGGSAGGIVTTLLTGQAVANYGYGIVFYILGSAHGIAFIVLRFSRRWHDQHEMRLQPESFAT